MRIRVIDRRTAAASAAFLLAAPVVALTGLQGGAQAFGPTSVGLSASLFLANTPSATNATTNNTYTDTFSLTTSPAGSAAVGQEVTVTLAATTGALTGPVPLGANGQVIRATVALSGAQTGDVGLLDPNSEGGTKCAYPVAPVGTNSPQGPWSAVGTFTATSAGQVDLALKQIFFDDQGNFDAGIGVNIICAGSSSNADYYASGVTQTAGSQQPGLAKTAPVASTVIVESLTVAAPTPQVALAKTVDVASLEEGAADSTVTYTLDISNPGSVDATITALSDDQVDPLPAECTDLIGDVLAPAGSATCSYDVVIDATNPTEVTNTASVTVDDGAGNDPATATDSVTVTVTDVLPTITVTKEAAQTALPAPAEFQYTVNVQNTSAEPVEITASSDTLLAGELAATCPDLAVGASVAAGATATCAYTINQADPGTFDNTFAVTVKDDDGNSVDGTGSQSVVALDAAASVIANLSVDPASREEPGGDFVFTLEITSGSDSEQTIDSITSGLSPACDALVGTALASAETKSCTFTVAKSDIGDFTQDVDVTTSVAEPASSDSATASAAYSVTDALPALSVSKTASTGTLPPGGGDVTFTVTIANESGEADSVEIVSADDSRVDLVAECGDPAGESIAPGEALTCEYTLAFDTPGTFDNTVTVTAKDEEGNEVSAEDTASVVVEEEPIPTLTPTPTPTPTPTKTDSGIPSTVTQQVSGVKCQNQIAGITNWTDPGQFGAPAADADPTFTVDLQPAAPEPGEPVSIGVTFDEGIANGPTDVEGSVRPGALVALSGGLTEEIFIPGSPYFGVPKNTARFPGQTMTLEDAFVLPDDGSTVEVTLLSIVFDSDSNDDGVFGWPEVNDTFTTVCNKSSAPLNDTDLTEQEAIGVTAAVPFFGVVTPAPTIPPGPTGPADGDDDGTDDTGDTSGGTLPQTGGNSLMSIALALLLFQIGLVLAVRSLRATPKVVPRH